MNIARTLTLALAACLGMGTAIAAPETAFLSGQASLDFSQNELALGNLLRIRTPATVGPQGSTLVNAALYSNFNKTVQMPLSGGQVSASGTLVQSVNAQIQLRNTYWNTDEFGEELPASFHSLYLSNLAIDFGSGTVLADVSAEYYRGYERFDYTFTDLGRLTVFEGNTSDTTILDGAGQVTHQLAGNFTLAPANKHLVLTSLYGANATGTLYAIASQATTWMTITASASFATSVPEPATWSLVLFGLLPLIAWGRRARQ